MKSEYFGEITDNLRWCFAFYNFNSMINSCGCILCHNGFWWITMRDFVLLLNELWSFLGGCKYSTLFRCFNDQILTSIIIPSRYSVDRSASHPANPITLNNESNFANLSEQLHTQNMSSRATFFCGHVRNEPPEKHPNATEWPSQVHCNQHNTNKKNEEKN